MSNELTTYSSHSIEEMLQSKRKDVLKLMGEENFTRELAFAAQAINANDKLKQADKNSVLQSVFNIALTGLSLNPISKLACLTPRFSGGKILCVLMPQYQGLVKLITDTGSVKNIYAYNVYEGDEFEYTLGTEIEISHKPKFKTKNITHSYAVAILPDGSKQVEVMSIEEINEIRAVSDSYKAYVNKKVSTCIWVDYYGEMCRKTVIKRITKYLPKSEKWEKVNEAIDIDNSDYPASNEQINYVLHLVNNSTIDDEEKARIETAAISGMSKADAELFIKQLVPNQIEDKHRIGMGLMYNQKDISATKKAHIHESL